MVKLNVTYVDSHIIVEQLKGNQIVCRVFNDVDTAIDFFRETITSDSSPVQPIEQ